MYKRFSMGLLSLAVVASLTACGSGNNNSTDTSSSSNKNSSTTNTSNQGENESVKLQVVGGDWDDASMTKFKTENPNNLGYQTRNAIAKEYPNYKVDYQNWGWAEDLDKKQRAAILSGSVPDIVHGETFMPIYASEDILTPLPDDIVSAVNPNFLLNNKEGKPVAVSPKGNLFLLFYNKDLLTQAGIDADNVQLKTWKDWQAVSEKLTAAGAGKFFGGGIPSHPHNGGALRFTAIARSVGADWGGGDTVTINTPEMAKALQFLRDMDHNFPKGIGNGTDEGPLYAMFNDDKTLGFAINGTWQANDAITKKLNYGVVPLPVAEGGVSSNSLVGFDYYGVTNASKNKEQAFNILRMMLSKDILGSASIHDITPPATTELQNDPAVLDSNPILKAGIEQVANGELKGLPVFNKNNSQIWDVINTKVISRATMTNDPIDTILKEAQAEAEKQLQ
ncbi:ABC transporter substrate-binding protein [Paenibacillus sp. FSL L8-0708]|uniref:ABC transporter substrate-binding protein n=1 Tax=Paenibacillus sp. FSL L8-0708 TaxID=2975311 RepID=UPI0030F74071